MGKHGDGRMSPRLGCFWTDGLCGVYECCPLNLWPEPFEEVLVVLGLPYLDLDVGQEEGEVVGVA